MNRASFAHALGRRTLRFIGDSVTSDHYQYLTRCVLNCSFETMHVGTLKLSDKATAEELKRYLTVRGFQKDVAHWALKLLQAASKDGYATGCTLESGGRVDFRRVNALPVNTSRRGHGSHREIVAAIWHTLLYWSGPALNKDDVVLINFGLHDYGKLRAQVGDVLRWWAAEEATGSAPRLLWRQTSPQHWPTSPLGAFSSFEDVAQTASMPCRAHEARDEQGVDLAGAAFRLYDKSVSEAVLQASSSSHELGDGSGSRDRGAAHRRWADVLDVFAATAERAEDHPRLTKGSLPVKSVERTLRVNSTEAALLADCTHYCIPGSVLRFWTQALLAWL